MGDAVKLTKAQRELLNDLPVTVSTNYAPAVALVSLGLAEWFAGRWSDLLDITPAGLSALTSKEQNNG